MSGWVGSGRVRFHFCFHLGISTNTKSHFGIRSKCITQFVRLCNGKELPESSFMLTQPQEKFIVLKLPKT